MSFAAVTVCVAGCLVGVMIFMIFQATLIMIGGKQDERED